MAMTSAREVVGALAGGIEPPLRFMELLIGLEEFDQGNVGRTHFD